MGLFHKEMSFQDIMTEITNLPIGNGLIGIVKSVCPKCKNEQSYGSMSKPFDYAKTKCMQCGDIYDAKEHGLWGIYYHGKVEIHETSLQVENLLRKINNMQIEVNRLKKHFFTLPDVNISINQAVDLWNDEYIAQPAVRVNPLEIPGAERRQIAWDKNSIANKEYVKKSSCELHGTGVGKTVILIAPGPSLKKNYQWLKQADKNKYVLIGCNIMPSDLIPYLDYFMVGDWLGKSADKEKQDWITDQDWSKTTGVFRVSAATDVVGNNAQGKFKEITWWKEKFVNHGEEYKLYGDWGGYVMVLTVMSAMMHFAIKLGCKRYVFVGYDCAYTDDEEYFGKKIPDMRTIHGMMPIQERDIHGQKILTIYPYAAQVEYMIKLCLMGYKFHNCDFINCTEGGIFHDHKLPFNFIKQNDLKVELGVK